MTLDALIMLTGAFIILEPQLGFPASWDRILLLAAGVFVVSLGIAVRRHNSKKTTQV